MRSAGHRLGDHHVTSVDVDAYLTKVAAERLDVIGLRPHLMTCDATGPLRGCYDRIVSAVAVRPIPASWLAALRPGGRLVTTISGTALILTADKTNDGGAIGRIQWDRAGFMRTRTGADYPRGLGEEFALVREAEGDQVSVGRWLREGSLPVYGATATITPDGACHLTRGRWQATIPPSG